MQNEIKLKGFVFEICKLILKSLLLTSKSLVSDSDGKYILLKFAEGILIYSITTEGF